MKKETKPEESVSVVVGRFQTDDLTDGHKQFLDYVLSKNFNSNLLIIGISPLKSTVNNPLDFEARKLMIESCYPGKFTILYIKDTPSDEVWSRDLDEKIDSFKNNRDVVLFGSRDCFIDHYFGKYKNNCEEYKQTLFVSATERRKTISKQMKNSKDWRAGNIYATQNRYPTVFSTVDCAIFDGLDFEHIYLAKKKDEKYLRFVGGFVDVNDTSFEHSAKRESLEETKLECDVVAYAGSAKIDDWRYRSEVDKIITHLFVLVKQFGKAEASDDIQELHLKKLSELKELDIEPCHRHLFKMINDWISKNKHNYIDYGKVTQDQLD